MVSANETVTAIASVTDYLVSAPASVTYVSTTTPANPVFSLAGGTYTGTQTLAITDTTPGAVIYYTIDGPRLRLPPRSTPSRCRSLPRRL